MATKKCVCYETTLKTLTMSVCEMRNSIKICKCNVTKPTKRMNILYHTTKHILTVFDTKTLYVAYYSVMVSEELFISFASV